MKTFLRIEQPAWLPGWVAARPVPAGDPGRLVEVLALAGENVVRASGGPFGAAVYDEATGERLACAVNVVIPGHCSLAHAEAMALGLAQQAAGHWTLAGRPCVLVSSAEPCAMCLGSLVWSGACRLLYAASRADVEAAGFDEGPRPARWRHALASRGIRVEGPRRQVAARAVLKAYVDAGGLRYNGRP